MVGNNVSHAMNKTKKIFCELSEKAFYLPEEDRWITLGSSIYGKTINKMELLQF
jgi:ribosomal protein L28